jgi:hypothetical protein
MTFVASGLGHARVHVGVLMGFASHCGGQVVTAGAKGHAGGWVTALLEPLEVTMGVSGLAFSGRAEQGCHIGLAFHVGLVREVKVTAVGLGLACEGGLEVLFRLGAFECCHGNLLIDEIGLRELPETP